MDCFRKALAAAGVSVPSDLLIPDGIELGEIPTICEQLNLKWYGREKKIWLNVEPVIVLYQISEINKYTGHAIFVSDISPLLEVKGLEILGLIKLEE